MSNIINTYTNYIFPKDNININNEICSSVDLLYISWKALSAEMAVSTDKGKYISNFIKQLGKPHIKTAIECHPLWNSEKGDHVQWFINLHTY